jgi:hypothetical protein
MFCLLLSALGFVEFEEAWNPKDHSSTTRMEQITEFTSLQMTSRNAQNTDTRYFFDRKPEPIQNITERNLYKDVFKGQTAAPYTYVIVIDERAVEKRKYAEEANVEYVYLISR